MAVRYIRKTGSDSNGGTSPSDAWLTLGKALGSTGIASGDVLYVGAGTYRETVAVAMTSATAETRIVADVDGDHTGDAGMVVWSGYTTSDVVASSASSPVTLQGRDFLTFERFVFQGGNAATIQANTAVSTDIVLRECTFLPGHTANQTFINVAGSAGVPHNWTIDRCLFLKGGSACVVVSLPAGTEYDTNFVIQNCIIIGGSGVFCRVDATGTNANRGGGVDIVKCTFLSSANVLWTNSAQLSIINPCTVRDCVVVTGGTAVVANTQDQVTENNNLFMAGATPRTLVTAGSTSIADGSIAPLLEIGQALLFGMYSRMAGTPMIGSPILGFGTEAGAALTVDALNRPRPAGGALTKAIGALERHDTGQIETTVTDAGGFALKLIGPGDHEFETTVNPSATNISIAARFDTNHGATNKPQAMILANPAIGVSANTQTMTAAVDTWQVLTFPSFTPTAKGKVTIRLISRAAAANGVAFFDTASIS